MTRPAGTARTLVARARLLGGDAVAVPGLSLREAPDAARARASLRAARAADLWIFTSPAAVRFAFRLSPSLQMPRRAQAFGVGAGTARALARHGIWAIAPHEHADSEGLLALPELADVRGRRIALIGAQGGRDLIASTLRRRGATVEAIHVYQRVAPRLTRRHFDALVAAPDPLVMLISSGEALRNLVSLLPAPLLARLHHQPLVVSSSRIAGFARDHGFGDIVEAASALPGDLLDGARWALARHRL
ncbi:uroporphyrinogen-III synthase [Dokdonella soli]|uniref:Uroporphyrinogen-III synthase n=1 Tax=Dokdonella soli TaxID=529810 RepID=A0ABP3TKJ9_9GAMM